MTTFTSSADLPGFDRGKPESVRVVRPLTSDEAELEETGPMYRVRATDGTGREADAFEDELDPKPEAQ